MEIIQIDENTRLRVEFDPDAESPVMWDKSITRDDEAYIRWVQGEVYGVIVERRWKATRVQVGNPDVAAVEEFVWEDDDSIWSCYLDDAYTAEVVAEEYFGIKKGQ